MADKGDPIMAYLTLARLRFEDHRDPILLRLKYAEGYPVRDEYSITGLHLSDLQRLADWLITLPVELYDPVADLHRALERAIHEDHKRWG